MKVRKNLAKIVLVGALVLGGIGCSNDFNYNFNGKIGKEQVKFYEKGMFDSRNILEVTSADGVKTKYIDLNDDLRADYVQTIIKNNIMKEGKYSRKLTIKHASKEMENKFNNYLKKIRNYKNLLNRK